MFIAPKLRFCLFTNKKKWLRQIFTQSSYLNPSQCLHLIGACCLSQICLKNLTSDIIAVNIFSLALLAKFYNWNLKYKTSMTSHCLPKPPSNHQATCSLIIFAPDESASNKNICQCYSSLSLCGKYLLLYNTNRNIFFSRS